MAKKGPDDHRGSGPSQKPRDKQRADHHPGLEPSLRAWTGATIQVTGTPTALHAQSCAHPGATEVEPMSHETGIAAHVAIHLHPCVDIWEAWAAFDSKRLAVPGCHVEKIHVSLGGEFDMLADVHADWTAPPGGETHVIGDWVNIIRKLKDGNGVCYIERTSTGVCMSVDA